jgi:hypothetical protein
MYTISLLVFSLLLALVSTRPIKISNIEPRHDVNGKWMDAHDGNIIQWTPGHPYYWYGIGYGLCNDSKWGCDGEFDIGDCGFRNTHAINLYISYDLVNWTFIRDILPFEKKWVVLFAIWTMLLLL